MNLDKDYWSTRYQENQTSWDVGEITTPLKNYFDQLTNKDLKILIPGAGNGYEVEYLFNNGFTNVTVIDLSELPLQNLLTRIPEFPKEKLRKIISEDTNRGLKKKLFGTPFDRPGKEGWLKNLKSNRNDS